MSDEEWRAVPDFDGYHASSEGRVRNAKGVVLLGHYNEHGYHIVTITTGKRGGRRVRAHRLVAAAFHGAPPDGLGTRHLDGNPANNRPENLRWGTQSENVLDAVKHGTWHWSAKTHCPQGHAYDEANTYVRNNTRSCRACGKESQRRHRAKKASC